MKKNTILSILFIILSIYTYAQDKQYWWIGGNDKLNGGASRLGTNINSDLIFVTNSKPQWTITKDGRFVQTGSTTLFAFGLYGADSVYTNYVTGPTSIGSTEGFAIGMKHRVAELKQLNNSPMIFFTDSKERLKISADGYIGIGTSSPKALLDVAGTLRFRDGAADGYVLKSDALGNASWQALNLNYLKGNVGIGIEPSALFHVHNKLIDVIKVNPGPTNSYSPQIQSNNPNSLKPGPPDPVGEPGGNSTANFLLTNRSSGHEITDGLIIQSVNSNAIFHLQEKGNMFFKIKNSFKMVIREGGNVGIGTINPKAKLEIVSTGALHTGHPTLLVKDKTNRGIIILESVKDEPTDLVFKSNGASKVWLSTRADGDDNRFDIYTNKLGTGPKLAFSILKNGKVGIGTSSPSEKLTVNGKVLAEEIVIVADVNIYPDYVFADDYTPISLKALKKYITINNHLPEIPTAKEVEKEGMQLGEMNIKLLKKIEELTLYTIGQENAINKQDKILEQQQNLIENLLERLEKLEEE